MKGVQVLLGVCAEEKNGYNLDPGFGGGDFILRLFSEVRHY